MVRLLTRLPDKTAVRASPITDLAGRRVINGRFDGVHGRCDRMSANDMVIALRTPNRFRRASVTPGGDARVALLLKITL